MNKPLIQVCVNCARTRRYVKTDRRGTVGDPVDIKGYWELEEPLRACQLHEWRNK